MCWTKILGIFEKILCCYVPDMVVLMVVATAFVAATFLPATAELDILSKGSAILDAYEQKELLESMKGVGISCERTNIKDCLAFARRAFADKTLLRAMRRAQELGVSILPIHGLAVTVPAGFVGPGRVIINIKASNEKIIQFLLGK